MVENSINVDKGSFEFWKNFGNVRHAFYFYLALALFLAVFIKPVYVLAMLILTFQLLFLIITYYKGYLFLISYKKEKSVPYHELNHYPTFNVLLANYKEKGETIRDLLANINKINYPKELIKAYLIIQEDDTTTLGEIANLKMPSFVELLKIHPVCLGEVQSKSRALNCGIKQCKNDIIVVFDSEDEPDVDQFLKVAYHFENNDLDVIQCSIGIYNSNQNFITRFFASEFRCFFEFLLNGIDRTSKESTSRGLYLPLGGTSFYVKKEMMERIKHFDMFNPTEDLIFSSSVYRHGGRIGHLPSITKGEAPVKLSQLLSQRTRWVKGFIISTCVLNRDVVKTCKQIGFGRWLSFNFWTLGSIIGLVSPMFFLLTLVWVVFQDKFFSAFFPYWISVIGLYGLMISGSIISMMIFAASSLKYRRYKDALLSPFFLLFSNLLLTISCYRALYQLITKPNMAWNKTEHGLAKKD